MIEAAPDPERPDPERPDPERPDPERPVEVSVLRLQPGSPWNAHEVATLDAAELTRADELASEEARRRFVAGHLLVRALLAGRLGVDPASLVFDRRCEHCGHPSHGRPRLVESEVSFSLSHSGGFVMVALGHGPVGADVEDLSRRAVSDRVVRRSCSDAEQGWWEQHSQAERHGAFLSLWTKKEALSKAVGLGVAIRFAGLDVLGATAVLVGPKEIALQVHGLDLGGAIAAVACAPGSVPLVTEPPGLLVER